MENQPSGKETTSQFEKLWARIAAAGIDFAVVGGVAVILNGYERQTRDLDIIVHPDRENTRKLLAFLATWGEELGPRTDPGRFRDLAGGLTAHPGGV